MAEENKPGKTPNEPNTAKNNDSSVDTKDASQVGIARELNNILTQVSEKLEKINQHTRSQASMIVEMSKAFQDMQENVSNINDSATNITECIEEIAETAVQNLSENSFEKINESLENIADTAEAGITSHSKNLSILEGSVATAGGLANDINTELAEGVAQAAESTKESSDVMLSFVDNTKHLHKSTKSFRDNLVALRERLDELFGGMGAKLKNIGLGILAVGKAVTKTLFSLVGAATQFVKFALTVPFTITQAAAEMGNKIRTDLVETIQTAAEETKEHFDFGSHIGKGVKEMTARGKGMLMAFQNPSSEMVKLFGYGASGIANMIKEITGNIAAMGHFSEIFGRSIMGNPRRAKQFSKMVKAFGFSSEDIHYLALDASTNLEHVNTRMARLGVTLSSVSKEFGVDKKRLSKNFMILRKDITQFGHLSDEDLTRSTARLTQMRVKLEDATAVFKKFSTFEDAANSVAILSQTFGMNLDAFDMIQAQNPEEIINMFRNSMLETGRSFQDLNRFEKDLMAQHTGMSAESLAALMNYRDLGLTHEEAVRRMQSERPEAKQMEALKKLNTAIKEVQKILTFDSPFQAFADGLMTNTTLSGDLKETLVSLSGGYQTIYEYAKGLDANTWTGLTRPIKLIIDIMRGIFQSDAFKKGLVTTVSTIASFVSDMFGVSSPDKVLSALASSLKSSSSKGGTLENTPGNKTFREAVLDKLKAINQKNLEAFSGLKGLSAKDFAKLKDPLEMLPLLRKMQKEAANKEELQPYFNNIIDNLTKRFGAINLKNKNFSTKQKDSIDLLVEGLKSVGKANKGNLGKLAKLSTRIMGAVIKGAGTAFVAVLKVVNYGIDEAEDMMKKEGKDVNLIEKFLHFDKGEFNKLGVELNGAIKTFFSKSSGMMSLTGWLLDGLSDIFGEILSFFAGTMAAGIDELFGTKFSKTRAMNLKQSSFKGKRQSTTASLQGVQASLNEGGGNIKNKDLASLLHDLEDKIETVSDKKMKASLGAAHGVLKERYLDESLSEDALKGVGLQTSALMQGIQDQGGGQGAAYSGISPASLLNADNVLGKQIKTEHKGGEGLSWKDSMFIKTAKEFDKLMKEKSINSQRLVSSTWGSTRAPLEPAFDNLPFKSFWLRHGEEIVDALKVYKNQLLSQPSSTFLEFDPNQEFWYDNYWNTFEEKVLARVAKSTTNKQMIADMAGPDFIEVNDKKSSPVEDGYWLNKLASASEHTGILSNLMHSVNPPLMLESNLINPMSESSVEHSPGGAYSSVSSIPLRSSNKSLTKQKATELYEKICTVKEEVKNQKHEINATTTFDKQAIAKLMKAMAQNNLVRELSKPENTNGAFYLLKDAIGSRCFNPGSDSEAASSSLE